MYYEKSLVSLNLNSKLFKFHCVRPSVQCMIYLLCEEVFYTSFILDILCFIDYDFNNICMHDEFHLYEINV